MKRSRMKREDLEQRLRSHLQAEAAGAEPSPEWWRDALSDLGEQRPARRWPLLPGPFAAIQPLHIFGATAVAAVLLGIVSLLVLAPGQNDSARVVRTPMPSAAPVPTPSPAPKGPGQPQGAQGPAGATSTVWYGLADRAFFEEVRDQDGATFTRMIVYQGDLTLAVKDDLGKALDGVAQVAIDRGGFVVGSSRQGDEGATITVRVPAEKFEETKQAVRTLAVRVLSETTRSQDVTEEYVDLQARLRNWEAAESQYLELMKKAANVEETLKVQERLVSVRQEIERIKGQMQYLERTSSMASITVSLRPASSPGPVLSTDWSAGETGKSALRSLSAFGQRLAGAAIWAGVYSPVWVLVGAVVFLLGRRLARR